MANLEKDVPIWCERAKHWKMRSVCLEYKRRGKYGCVACDAPEKAMQVELPKAEAVRGVRRRE